MTTAGVVLQPPAHCPKETDLSCDGEVETELGSSGADISRPGIELQRMGTGLPETWETPTKTSKCILLRRHRTRERGVEGILPGLLIWFTLETGVSNPGFRNPTFTSD